MKNIKKRVVSFFLFAVMAIACTMPGLFTLTGYAQNVNVSISPAFGGWENWKGSPNNPTPGGEPGVTQLLVGISGKDGQFPDALNTTELEYSITFSWQTGDEVMTKSINLKPATVAQPYKLVRFETVLGEGDNQFIPYKNQSYTVAISVTDKNGVVYSGKSADYAFVVPMHPVVNGVVDTSYEYSKPQPRYPYDLEISQYHSGTEDVDGQLYYKSDWEMWNGQQMLILLADKQNIYMPEDISSGVEVGICFNGSDEYKLTLDSTVDMGSTLLLRLPTEKVFTPEDGEIYSIDINIYKNVNGENIVAYRGTGENFTANGVKVAPQTGDGAMIYIALAVASIMAMVYILIPKSRKVNM